ncbi:hypothetical protein [Treponema zioleckii]|uniref:hypothetical protein n=1 Tax=Treponema zioleckii TaxID=331680 RepID=UPI00168BE609|nr:hypothetical protein [Treponema zioleckii]
MRKFFGLILAFIFSGLMCQNIFADESKVFEISKVEKQITVTYGGKLLQYISWEEKSEPSVVLTTFFISYLEESDFWKNSVTNLGRGGVSKDEVLSEMEKKRNAFYGLVDRLVITVNPDKIELLGHSKIDTIERAYFKIKIAYSYRGEEDAGEDDVLMIKDRASGDWYVAELPL